MYLHSIECIFIYIHTLYIHVRVGEAVVVSEGDTHGQLSCLWGCLLWSPAAGSGWGLQGPLTGSCLMSPLTGSSSMTPPAPLRPLRPRAGAGAARGGPDPLRHQRRSPPRACACALTEHGEPGRSPSPRPRPHSALIGCFFPPRLSD